MISPVLLSRQQAIATLACTTAASILVAIRLHNDDQFIVYIFFTIIGPLLATIDTATIRLPDRITLPSYPAVLSLATVDAIWTDDGAAVIRAVEAASVVLATYLVLCLCTDLGMGDLKYAGLVALVLGVRGWEQVLEGTLLIWGLATVWAASLICCGQRTGRMPIGPFMTVGTLLALVQL